MDYEYNLIKIRQHLPALISISISMVSEPLSVPPVAFDSESVGIRSPFTN